jgi:hypothetical protein
MAILAPAILDGAARIESSGDSRLARRALALYLLFGIAIWTQHLAFGSGVIHAWVGPVVLAAWAWTRGLPTGLDRPAARATDSEPAS